MPGVDQDQISDSINFMRIIFLLTITLLASCESKKDAIENRRQAIKKEMKQVNAYYYSQLDSLESVKSVHPSFQKDLEIAEQLTTAGKWKIATLISLQREYDSLEVELSKY